MQELSNSIKRPNLRLLGIKPENIGKEVHAKGICNMYNKGFPNLKKKLPIQVQKTSRSSNSVEQNRTSLLDNIIKTTSTDNRERILKTVREKMQITYKCKPIKLIADLPTEP
jgi:hypothetical protein